MSALTLNEVMLFNALLKTQKQPSCFFYALFFLFLITIMELIRPNHHLQFTKVLKDIFYSTFSIIWVKVCLIIIELISISAFIHPSISRNPRIMKSFCMYYFAFLVCLQICKARHFFSYTFIGNLCSVAYTMSWICSNN